jgi:SagB-type dehydrogenase family enzyme
MSLNKEIKHALDYHESTKHSEASLLSSRHYLDFDNKPMPFKIYLKLPYTNLPTSFTIPEVNALSCISGVINEGLTDNVETLARAVTTKGPTGRVNANRNIPRLEVSTLAAILFFSAGITREIKYTHGKYYMRAASATGALYPIELYVVCDDISPDLEAGVYHFSPADFTLTRIRKGRYKQYLARATAHNQDIANSDISIIFTSIAWRNAWKYQARSYRHWFWDSGVIAANLLATTSAIGLPTRIIMGFLDDDISQLLCLEEQKEAPIAITAIGKGSQESAVRSNKKHTLGDMIPPMSMPSTRPLSKRGEIDYPEIWDLDRASKLTSKEEIEQWISNAHHHHHHHSLLSTSSPQSQKKGSDNENSLIVTPSDFEENFKASLSLKETILWRGSSRKFARTNISISALKAILYSSTTGVPLDILKDQQNSLIDIYFIANAVDGIIPGAYFYNRSASAINSNNGGSIEKIKEVVSSRNISGYLCLGQTLFSDASVVFFLMTDLQSVLGSLGNRGYKTSQLEAGIIAGKIYLAAYALGIGASGSTFFDDAVTEFFSPHAANKSTMLAVGVGAPAYNAKPGRILPKRLSREQLLTQDFS